MGDDLNMKNLPDKVSKAFLNVAAILAASGVALIFLFGFYEFFQHRENKCTMTWMYEFPHFVRIPMKNGVEEKFPMYGLYIYAEGRQVEVARRGEYTGIPVLFLPGNAGSYKQVRSFASVALYKAIDMKTPFHFDFFTIDFNEEASGLYGYVLSRQLEYSRLALNHIINLYEDFHHVVIIGHSMGGIVAKTINADEIRSHLILTLATPHAHPVLITDPEFDLFYYNSWKNSTREMDPEVTVVSIAGGDNDLLVVDKLTQSPLNDFQTSTLAVPGAWVSTDHLCILWCNQFVKVIVRILFDLVEYKNLDSGEYHAKVSTNKELIDSVLDYHLYKRPSGKSFHSAFPDEKTLPPPKAWWEEQLVLKHCRKDSSQKTYLMFPLQVLRQKIEDDEDEYNVLVSTSNTKAKNWVYGCKGQDFNNGIRYCSNMDNLSPSGEILPSRQKIAHLDFKDIRKYSHIIVKTTPMPSPFCVYVEPYKNKKVDHIPRTLKTKNRIFFHYSAKSLDKRVSAWRLNAVSNTPECKNDTSSIAMFREGNYQSHAFVGNQSLVVRFTNWSSEDASLLLYLNPECEFNVTLRLAYLETAGQMFRTYIWLLPAYITSIVMLSFFFQRHHEDWENFHWLLVKNAFHLTAVPGMIVGGLLCCIPSDYLKIMEKSEVSIFLPVLLFFASFACVFLLTAAGWYFLIGSGNALHAVLMKFLSKRLGKIPDKVTDHALDIVFTKFPVIVAVFLVSLSAATCGGLGITVGFLIYILKIFKMYEDLLEDLVKGKIKDVREGLSPLNFHQTCASLWFMVTCLNIPSVVYWIKNFSYGESPQWDMSLYTSLMLTPAVAILWQGFVPQFNPAVWTMQRYLSYVNGVLVVVWGTHRLYIVSFVITLHLITLAFTQLVSCLLSLASKAEAAAATASTDNGVQASAGTDASTAANNEQVRGEEKKEESQPSAVEKKKN